MGTKTDTGIIQLIMEDIFYNLNFMKILGILEFDVNWLFCVSICFSLQ